MYRIILLIFLLSTLKVVSQPPPNIAPPAGTPACWILLSFADKKICKGDTAHLYTYGGWGQASFSIYPNNFADASDSNNILVYPQTTTTFYVTRTVPGGCRISLPVTVTVLDSVQLMAMPDTSVCPGSVVTLRVGTNADSIRWSPANVLNDPYHNIAVTRMADTTTTFYVSSWQGSCSATASVQVQVLPKARANAGSDKVVCLGRPVLLNGSAVADSFYWSSNGVIQSWQSLQPLVSPVVNSTYTLTAFDTTGCTEKVTDTVQVKVIPSVKAFAGNDTAIVYNQPLQLHASGGNSYQWMPAAGLSNDTIADPFVTIPANAATLTYKVRVFVSADCFADDEVTIRIFRQPGIYVPSAFTPNNDGLNDVLTPVLPGAKKLDFFKIYNRFGQQVFGTNTIGAGWNGMVNGVLQSNNTFVYMIRVTYPDNTVQTRKGTIVLIN